MLKTKLPVIVLRNLILLPHGEIRLEISNEADKKIIEKSVNENNGYLLLISPEYILEEELDIADLPEFGTIGKITGNFELPNKNLRITILGVNRANVFEYPEPNENGEIIEAIIGPFIIKENDLIEEEARLRTLKNKFSSYVLSSNNISNNFVAKINEEKSLETATDIIVNLLPLEFDIKNNFIKENDSIKRADILLDILSKEKVINELENDLENKLKIDLDDAQREYILREKIKVIKEELGDDDKDAEIEEIRNNIMSLKANMKIKDKLLKELKKYESTPITSPEVAVIKNYLDVMISLPWGIYDKDTKSISSIEKELNKTHFGLKDAKTRILEYISIKELNNDLKSPIICLVGPPGVGKTSLAFSIANSLNRKFTKISLGGVSDENEIIGHRRTYVGARPGRIINGLKNAGTSNPVFLIDEVDKMGKDYKGDPSSSMLEVLDSEQNKLFTDNFLEEPFDLSKVMFILTANDISGIPYALRDRLEIIELNSYTEYEKIDIVNNYMFKKLLLNHGLIASNISIEEDALKKIINSYTKEAGVRELERVLSSIMRKIAKKKVETKRNVRCRVTTENIEEYLGKEKYTSIKNDSAKISGVVNGLGYTPFGGEIIPLEVTYYKGKGNIILTGSLGEVMRESANIAIGYIKSHLKEFNIDPKLFENNDIHINAVEAGIPKDGPSAGIALTSAIISSLSSKIVPKDTAMTGEITLMGNVLEIGGLKEKVIGAFNQGIKRIFIPISNEKDIDEIPSEIKEKVKFIPVKKYDEIYKKLFK